MVKVGLNHLDNGRPNIFKFLGFAIWGKHDFHFFRSSLGETRFFSSFFDYGSPSSIILLLLRFFVDPSSILLLLLRFFWFCHLWRFDFVMIFSFLRLFMCDFIDLCCGFSLLATYSMDLCFVLDTQMDRWKLKGIVDVESRSSWTLVIHGKSSPSPLIIKHIGESSWMLFVAV